MMITYPEMTVIRPVGLFNATKAGEFHTQVRTAVAQKATRVIVDLAQVESIDSAGLMALIHGLRLTQALERRFSLCSVSPSLRMIFELTQLDRVFEIFESLTAVENAIALAGFGTKLLTRN